MKPIYVVELGRCFYKGRFENHSFVMTKDIQDAKWFYDKTNAEIIAKELSGEVRGVIDVMIEDTK